MNAVVKAGIGLVVVAGVGLGLGPYFIGVKGEEAYKEYLAQYEKYGFDVEIKHYSRTWFSASAEYQLIPNDNITFGLPAEWLPFFESLTIKDDIQHGPLVPYKTGFKPGIVSFSSHFVVDQDRLKSWDLGLEDLQVDQLKDMLIKGAKGKSLLGATGYIGFDQRFYSRLETAVLDYQEDWGTLTFEPIILEVDTDLELTEYKAHYAWTGLKLENTDEPLSLSMEGLKGREQGEYIGPMMWNMDGHIKLLPMVFKPATEQFAWSAFDIDFSSNFQDQKGDFEAKFEFKDLNTNGFDAEQLKWTIALNHLDVATYTEMMDVFKQINAETLGATPEMTDALVQRTLIEHHDLLLNLLEGIGFSIKDVELKSNEGNLSAHISLDVGEVPADIMQNPLLMINAFSGDAALTFDKGLIPDAQQKAIAMPVMMGFLKDEGDTLTSTLKLDAGMLDVNGQKLPLGAMVAQNVQSQGPAPAQPQAQPEAQPSLPINEPTEQPEVEADQVQ
jgi:uncharacterized protein YdgA (DUF945 family)